MKLVDSYKHLPIGVLLVDENNSIRNINDWLLNKLGHTTKELKGQPLNAIFPDTQLNQAEEKRTKIQLANGAFWTVVVSVIDIPNNALNAILIQEYKANIEDINAITDSKTRLEAIINTAVDGIMTINRKGIVESMNKAAAVLFGYDPKEVIGKNVNILMDEPHHSNHDQYLHNYQKTGEKKIIGKGREVMARKKNGEEFPIHLSISEVKLKSGTIYTGILHDLTAQKAAEEKNRRYAKELERSNRELQDFAYVSSHDLQEPLRKIRAFGDRVQKKEKDNLSEKGADYLNRMVNAAERMQKLINDLLSFSRISTHAKNFVQVNLNEVVQGVLSDLEVSIEENHAKIELSDLPTIDAEPFQMRQLFQNLIGNAIKFKKPDADPVINVYAEVKSQDAYDPTVTGQDFVKIFIKDNGIGFDDQYKDKIFQIFQRLEGRKYEGSGIGLSICKRIATRHGGDIEVESELNKGTTFIITLPLEIK